MADGFVPKLAKNCRLIANHLVAIETPSHKWVDIQLFQVLAQDGSGKRQLIIGSGVEVRTKRAPDFRVPYDSATVKFDGKLCSLDLGGASYLIAFHTDPKVSYNEPPLGVSDRQFPTTPPAADTPERRGQRICCQGR